MPGCRILVVDDDPMIRTVASSLLEAIGCSVTTLADGATLEGALSSAATARAPIDMVLLDLQLAGASGLEVCRRLRAAGFSVAVVCMSADAFTVDTAVLIDAGFDDVIHKPFSLADLRACVERYAGMTAPWPAQDP